MTRDAWSHVWPWVGIMVIIVAMFWLSTQRDDCGSREACAEYHQEMQTDRDR